MNDQPYIEQMPSSGLKPVEVRRSTDRIFMLLLPLNLLLWLGFGIYYISTNSNIIYMLSYSGIACACLGIAAVFSVIVLVSISNQWRNKIVFIIMSYIAIIIASTAILILFLLISYTRYLFKSENTREYPTFLFLGPLTFSVLCLMYYLTIFSRAKEVRRPLLAQMITEPSRAILDSLPTVLLSIPIVTFSTIMFMLHWNWLQEQHFGINSERTFWSLLCAFIFGFGGIFLSNFIWNFGFTVMGHYFAHYYISSNTREEICVYQSIKRIAKYHFGSIAVLSTPLLPSVYALAEAFKNNHAHGQQSGFTITNFFSKVCLILDISDYASMQTAVHGHSALQSIKQMFDLRRSDSVLFLVTNAASQKMTEITAGFAAIIGSILSTLIFRILLGMGYLTYLDIDFYLNVTVVDKIMAVMYVNLMSKFLIRPAMCAFSIQKMAILRESTALEESCHLQDLPK